MNTTPSSNLSVYKSSAGSGKTFTLVKEFLKLCFLSESGFAFASVLAITFTNKATFEMKGRIIKALKELAELKEGEESVLAKLLILESGLSQKIIQEKSKRILGQILHNYADFNISTIDRFSHKLIRTFAKDLGLSHGFQVQIDEKELLQDVIGILIDSIGEEQLLTELLLNFAFYKIEAERSWKLDADLISFAESLLNEEAQPYLEQVRKSKNEDFKALNVEYSEALQDFEQQIKKIGKKAIEQIQKNEIEDASFAGRSKISLYFRRLKGFDIKYIKPTASLVKDIDADKWHSTKCTADQKNRIDAIKTELLQLYNAANKIVDEGFADYLFQKEVLKNLYSLSLLNEIEKYFSSIKKEEKLLNISDFNRLLAKVVLSEPMPFIYERLGERFQHIMIDEFQDTSVLQFMNLMPLIEDSLSKGKENLIVGDAKQAIYRFRGGEVEQFAEMPNYVPKIAEDNEWVASRMETLRANYQMKVLDVNYRSAESVVEFNNALFAFVKNELELSPKVNRIFEQHEQKSIIKDDSSLVAISFAEGSRQEIEEQIKEQVLNDINTCLEQGFLLKDIAILCRKKSQAALMADFLSEERIEIISSEALLLSNSKEVLFLMSVSRWVQNDEDPIAKKNILEYLFQHGDLKGTLNEIYETYLSPSFEFQHFFKENNIDVDRIELQRKSVNEFLESLIRSFGLDEEYNLYLQTLQDVALDYTKSKCSSMLEFLEWWEDNQARISISIPDDLNAISIMTIHKSKGLEFPIVIYPFANQKVEHSSAFKKSYLWTQLPPSKAGIPYALVEFNTNLRESSKREVYDEELEKREVDLINDTYVALTRASKRMYIYSESVKTSEMLSLPKVLNAFVTHKGIVANEKGIYQFGLGEDKLNDEIEEEVKDLPFQKMEYLSNPWQDKLDISLESSRKWNEGESQRKYGTMLHNILSKISTQDEIKRVIEEYLLLGEINGETAIEIEQKLRSILNHPEVEPYFAKGLKLKNEASLLDEEGNILRPDRVVFLKDKVVVIDYKTGEANESHNQQLMEYINLIGKTTNQTVDGIIIYTEREEVVKVA